MVSLLVDLLDFVIIMDLVSEGLEVDVLADRFIVGLKLSTPFSFLVLLTTTSVDTMLELLEVSDLVF